MYLPQKFKRKLRSQINTTWLFTLVVFSTFPTAGAAFLGSHYVISVPHPGVILATFEGETKANAKDLTGQIQEVTGEITGSTKDEIAWKAKQSESYVDKIMENLKDLAPVS